MTSASCPSAGVAPRSRVTGRATCCSSPRLAVFGADKSAGLRPDPGGVDAGAAARGNLRWTGATLPLRELTTRIAAVPLSSVVAATDVERPTAVAAAQLEEIQLVHPSRMAKNWTSTSETTTVRAYWRVHPPLVHRGLRWRPGPSLFPSDRPDLSQRATSRSAGPLVPGPLVPWSPGPR